MFAELLLEIGTEEIPSDYLVNALRALKGLAEGYMRDTGSRWQRRYAPTEPQGD